MERAEAEAVYDAGAVVVEVLLGMDGQVRALTGRVDKLERQLAKNSRNGSVPPSSDRSGSAPTRRSEGSSGRSRGAQSGHEGRGRELLPTAAVDEVVRHWPGRCGCGHVFCERERVVVRAPARHRVEELPRLAVGVVEHQCRRVRCPGCGVENTGELPAEVAVSAFGPRLRAAVGSLAVRHRVSRRDTVELCGELFGARICAGSVDRILARTGDALERPYRDLARRARRSGHLNVDETGWRLKGGRRALWGAFTDRIAPAGRRQICWAHLRRDFQAHAEGLAAEREFGESGLRVCEELFWAWEIYQHTGGFCPMFCVRSG